MVDEIKQLIGRQPLNAVKRDTFLPWQLPVLSYFSPFLIYRLAVVEEWEGPDPWRRDTDAHHHP